MMDTPERTLSLVAAAMLFVIWVFLSRSTSAASRLPDEVVLRYSRFLRIVAWLLALAPLTLLVWMVNTFRFPSNDRAMLVVGALLGFSVLAGLLLLETQRVRITLTGEGIRGESPWRSMREMRWSQIEEVSFSGLNRWFVVRSMQGQVIRVSVFLNPVDQFVTRIKEHVPAERYILAQRGFKML